MSGSGVPIAVSVPPGIDPSRLEIGDIYEWFKKDVDDTPKKIKWYPGNFTRHGTNPNSIASNDIHKTDLDLYVVGYGEMDDPAEKQILPKHKILAKIASFQNNHTAAVMNQQEKRDLIFAKDLSKDVWLIPEDEVRRDLLTYRVGYFKLAVRQPEVKINLERPEELRGYVKIS